MSGLEDFLGGFSQGFGVTFTDTRREKRREKLDKERMAQQDAQFRESLQLQREQLAATNARNDRLDKFMFWRGGKEEGRLDRAAGREDAQFNYWLETAASPAAKAAFFKNMESETSSKSAQATMLSKQAGWLDEDRLYGNRIKELDEREKRLGLEGKTEELAQARLDRTRANTEYNNRQGLRDLERRVLEEKARTEEMVSKAMGGQNAVDMAKFAQRHTMLQAKLGYLETIQKMRKDAGDLGIELGKLDTMRTNIFMDAATRLMPNFGGNTAPVLDAIAQFETGISFLNGNPAKGHEMAVGNPAVIDAYDKAMTAVLDTSVDPTKAIADIENFNRLVREQARSMAKVPESQPTGKSDAETPLSERVNAARGGKSARTPAQSALEKYTAAGTSPEDARAIDPDLAQKMRAEERTHEINIGTRRIKLPSNESLPPELRDLGEVFDQSAMSSVRDTAKNYRKYLQKFGRKDSDNEFANYKRWFLNGVRDTLANPAYIDAVRDHATDYEWQFNLGARRMIGALNTSDVQGGTPP